MAFETHIWVLLAALIMDGIVGDPDFLWRKLPHPVVWIGKLIEWLDECFNKTTHSKNQRQVRGLLSLLLLIFLAALSGLLLEYLANNVIEAIIVAILLSTKSLYEHVKRVVNALEQSGLEAGRTAVAQIVGRDPQTLDRAAVCRAAIESLAENFSDGIIAPAFWYLIGGLPGLFIYKAVNTADSMIGHKSPRYMDFGRAAAKFDDLINLPASRLTALLCVIAAILHAGPKAAAKAIKTIWRDAAKHRSPNAGWPEGAMAGALDIALSGPRSYGGKTGHEPWVNETGNRNITHSDIIAGLRLYVNAVLIFAGALALIATTL